MAIFAARSKETTEAEAADCETSASQMAELADARRQVAELAKTRVDTERARRAIDEALRP